MTAACSMQHAATVHLSDFTSTPFTCFLASLTLYSGHTPPRCTWNSPGILLQSKCTCSSLLEIFFPQASSRITVLSLPLHLYSEVTWILSLKFNTHVTDISDLPSFNYFSLQHYYATYYVLVTGMYLPIFSCIMSSMRTEVFVCFITHNSAEHMVGTQ